MADFTFHKDMLTGIAFNGARHERANITESYVCCPPAAVITDSQGGMWTMGDEYIQYQNKKRESVFEWNVVRNGVDMDITAARIEMRKGIIYIFSPWNGGWRRWSYSRRHFI